MPSILTLSPPTGTGSSGPNWPAKLAACAYFAVCAVAATAQEPVPDIPDYVAPDNFISWVGTWDLNEETCADPDSIYRLRLTRDDAAFGTGEGTRISAIQQRFQEWHTDYRIKLADMYDRGEDQSVYRIVFPDSRPMMYVEKLPGIDQTQNFFRRIYIRCPQPEGTE
ncbi:hypothetical protein ACI5KX_01465 [Erythrobacter sp. GH1-10]|uniref:hypothetical protein n=1 Tax=Erythrobacter sp. GH1-10 TaxID=3349334 RepID=UPI003877FE37